MKRHDIRYTIFAFLISILSGSAPAGAGDLYDDAMKRSLELEREGKTGAAIGVLQPLADQYAQDHDLVLRLGWLHFSVAQYAAAERWYRQALALGEGSVDARHGLAWTLLRLDRKAEARPLFEAVVRARPEDATAREGLAWCLLDGGERERAHAEFQTVLGKTPASATAQQGLRMSAPEPVIAPAPSVRILGQAYQDHRQYQGAVGFALVAPLVIKGRVLLQPAYRYTHYFLKSGSASATTAGDAFDQHEGYMTAGLVTPRVGAQLHYGLVNAGDLAELAHIVGVSGRFSPHGDILLGYSVSLYEDMQVHRIDPAYRLPIPRVPWLSALATLAVQVATTEEVSLQLDAEIEALVAGSLQLEATWKPVRVVLGGRVGEEVRPVYLSLPAVCNSLDRVRFSGWVGGSVALGAGLWMDLTYEVSGLEQRNPAKQPSGSRRVQQSQALLHFLSAGLSWSAP